MPRDRFILTVPETVPIGNVFGSDGILYWAKDWEQPEESLLPDGLNVAFIIRGFAKREYIDNMFETATRFGCTLTVVERDI